MNNHIAGVILAGGLSRRMGGGDKPLLEVDGQTLLERVIARLSPQATPLLLNANGDPRRFDQYGLAVRTDVIAGHGGPLVGVLTAMEWAGEQGLEWVVTAAADTPLFPADLVQRLRSAQQAEQADITLAVSDGRDHPVFALWPVRLAAALRHALVELDMRKVGAFMDRHRVVRVEWPSRPFDPFFNVNSPDDVAQLERLLLSTP